METQETLALVVVGIAAAALAVAWIRKRLRGPASLCQGDCECPARQDTSDRTLAPPVESAGRKR